MISCNQSSRILSHHLRTLLSSWKYPQELQLNIYGIFSSDANFWTKLCMYKNMFVFCVASYTFINFRWTFPGPIFSSLLLCSSSAHWCKILLFVWKKNQFSKKWIHFKIAKIQSWILEFFTKIRILGIFCINWIFFYKNWIFGIFTKIGFFGFWTKIGILSQCAPLSSLFIIRRCVDYTQTSKASFLPKNPPFF